MKHVQTDVLDIAYHEHGPADGPRVVVLLHGFPYDVHAYDEVAPSLAEDGCRVLVPYLRGFGETRFLEPATPRSGEQAALGQDLVRFLDSLEISRAVLAGYDWGGRAACVAAIIAPERVRALVSCGGYNVQDIAASIEPGPAAQEHRLWYQYYFHTERGRAGLTKNRRDICRLLWTLWSPAWQFSDETFERTAGAFESPDFVEVVIHSYRHRFGYAPGDPALLAVERTLAGQPPISVPTINLSGGRSGLGNPTEIDRSAAHFAGPYERRILEGIGHNVPQEAPAETIAAIRDLLASTPG